MSEYVLKINKGNKNINKLIKTEGYTFNPKNDIVKSFTVYDEKFLNKIILNKFTKEYKKVKSQKKFDYAKRIIRKSYLNFSENSNNNGNDKFRKNNLNFSNHQ